MSVVEVLRAVSFAWVFYGLLGGFIILAIIGGLAGNILSRKYSDPKRKNTKILIYSVLLSILPVLFLSVLDYIIGPW